MEVINPRAEPSGTKEVFAAPIDANCSITASKLYSKPPQSDLSN